MVLNNLKGFRKNLKKTEIFHDRGPVEKWHFFFFCICTFLQILQPNEWIFTFQVYFLDFSESLLNWRDYDDPKNWSFRWLGTWEKWNFLHIHNFTDFAAKWVNIYILGILMSYYDGSLQFKRLSDKSKKLKFFMTADLLKNGIFWWFSTI